MGRQSRSSSSQRTLQKLRVWALCIANGELEGRIAEIYPCGGICKKPHIRDFTQCQVFLTPSSTHVTDDDETRMAPKSYSQGDPFGWLQTGIEGFDRL